MLAVSTIGNRETHPIASAQREGGAGSGRAAERGGRMNELYLKRITLREEQESKDRYVYSLPLVRNFRGVTLRSPVTFFCGENGVGKSTLLEALAVHCGFSAEGGTKNFNFATKEMHSPLYHALSVAQGHRPQDGFFLRAESALPGEAFQNRSAHEGIAEIRPENLPSRRVAQRFGCAWRAAS